MEQLSPGIFKGGVSDSISELKIPKYSATKGKTDRVTILKSSEKLIVRLMYLRGIGYVYEWAGDVCKKMANKLIIQNIYPILVYPSDNEGNVIGGTPKLMRLQISNFKDKKLQKKETIIKSMGQSIENVDLLFVGFDETKTIDREDGSSNDWIDYDIEGPVGTATYKSKPEWKQVIMDQWQVWKENIINIVAQTISSDEEYYQLLAQLQQQQQQQKFQQPSFQNNQKQVADVSHMKAIPQQIPQVNVFEEEKKDVTHANADDFFSDLDNKTEPQGTKSSSDDFNFNFD